VPVIGNPTAANQASRKLAHSVRQRLSQEGYGIITNPSVLATRLSLSHLPMPMWVGFAVNEL